MRNLLILPVLASFLNSCGADSSQSTANTFEGDWGVSCVEGEESGRTTVYSESWTLTNSTYSRQISYFDPSDTTCEGAKSAEILYSGSLKKQVVDSSDSIDGNLDFVVLEAAALILEESLIETLNNESVCSGGWSRAESKALTTDDCKDRNGSFTYVGASNFDVYKMTGSEVILGTDLGEFYFEAADRPTNPKTTRVLYRL
jgi:hypothetical protein